MLLILCLENCWFGLYMFVKPSMDKEDQPDRLVSVIGEGFVANMCLCCVRMFARHTLQLSLLGAWRKPLYAREHRCLYVRACAGQN